MLLRNVFFGVLLVLGGRGFAAGGDTISLAGRWCFRMDPQDRGEAEKWFLTRLPERVVLPGSMLENGKGEDVTVHTQWTASIYDSSWFFEPRMAKYREQGNLKFPFWLTPVKHYVGAAWYQREVVIPEGWKGRPVRLLLERPHSETTVWVDDKAVGTEYGFCTGQVFALGAVREPGAAGLVLSPGRHIITLRIDNRIKDINVGQDSHSLTDQTQGNWNGVVGRMLLMASAPVWVEDVQVFPDVARKMARVHLLVRGLSAGSSGTVRLSAKSFNTAVRVETGEIVSKYALREGRDSVVVELPMGGNMVTWDEFDPALYRLTVKLEAAGARTDVRVVEFGMREFTVKGTHFEINGRPVHLRGTVENCVFPLTGYAPMDEASWERIFRIARSFGLNHMRFHSYCPPEAAFAAADRVGFYLQPEGPSWANHGSSLGDGKPIDQFIFDETNRMARAYGNYASFCMLAYGNEPRGGHQVDYLTRFIHYWKDKDKRRVYTGADVGQSWPLVPDNEYMVKSRPRGLSWDHLPETMSDYHAAIDEYPVPYVTHEMGQWCVYPDFSEVSAYRGVNKAKNFELFRESLQEQGMGDEAKAFLMASGKLQALCYKAEIEKSLRTRGSAGFQLLCLNDYTGQGTALVGVLNAFWKPKGYITAREFSHFCNTTVPLVRMPKFVFTNAETLSADVELYHYGKAPLRGAVVSWMLRGERGGVEARGEFAPRDVPIGNCFAVGEVKVPLKGIRVPSRLHLEVAVKGTAYVNGWDCWVYPGGAASGVGRGDAGTVVSGAGRGVYYCTELDEKARAVLDEGGKVFLNGSGKVVKGKEVVMNFTPVFWNTSWFKMRPPHTLGLLIDTASAAFSDFPTSYHSDLQWWDVLKGAQVMHLEDFPRGFRPLVQPIDTWFLNRRLGLIFEARVGKGRLIVSGADLSPEVSADRPAARQLYYSILKYMGSQRFAPVAAVKYEVVKDLFDTPSKFVFSSYTKSGPDELRSAQRIDRKVLVTRHNVVNVAADPLSSLSVGNGRFAFTVDVTGLQSFPEQYDKGVSLGTESEWGWHSFINTGDLRFEETLKTYDIHGRAVPYAVQWPAPERNKKAADWFRQNVHRLQLGNIGFELIKKDGTAAVLSDLGDIRQELNLWTGEIKSHFMLEGIPVDVSTVAHPEQDGVAVKVSSALLRQGRLKVRIRFPYPTGAFADDGDNWSHREAHRSVVVSSDEMGALLRHDLDTTHYFLGLRFGVAAGIQEREPHYFVVSPAAGDELSFTGVFSEGGAGVPEHAVEASGVRSRGAGVPDYDAVAAASAAAWADYWQKGGVVDLSGSTDPRASELERRIVLSQYLMRVQEAGDCPPQETGLTYNSWFGKPHLEMHWWHAAHFALWGHPELLERSLDWYKKAAGGAREIAERQGYKGVRWQKMTDPAGRESPSSVGAFLVWQQPHFIYMAELCYRAEEGAQRILDKYKDLVFATADFMASYAWYDPATRRYILGKGLIPAQERFREDSTFNPCFELAYWRWALATAQQWRARLGMGPDTGWQRVERELASLPQGDVRTGGAGDVSGLRVYGGSGVAGAGGDDGVRRLYFPTESAVDAYTNPRYRTDHPAVLATYGFLPATQGLDTAMMHATFNWIDKNWRWEDTWGWDFPLTAMCATRLGLPDKAIDALLMPVQKNRYLPDGHNYQDGRLRCYLPGNGGLLSAIALMCAGYDGAGRANPGIPQNGKWTVRWEGLSPMP